MRESLPTQSNDLPAPDPPAPGESWACFLDVDGTLVEIAHSPEAVKVPPALAPRLARLRTLLGGALALVSGRPISGVDRLLTPLRLPTAGIHGAERRLHDGSVRYITFDAVRLNPVRQAFDRFAATHEGTLVEDKRFAVALHYRRRPDLASEVRRLGAALLAHLGDEFQMLEGKMVLETRPAAATKGSAVDAFLQERPFVGRRPVYIGDDRTDEDAFQAVNAVGGVSVVVGTPATTAARNRLADVAEVHRWLDAVAAALQGNA